MPDANIDEWGLPDPLSMPRRVPGPEDFYPLSYSGGDIPTPGEPSSELNAASLAADNGGE